MKIAILFLLAIAKATAAINLRGNEETLESKELPVFPDTNALALDESPDSRELRTYGRSSRNKDKSRRGTRTNNRSRNWSNAGSRYTTLFIVEDDNSRSTRTCADDTARIFRWDFDETVIASSDRDARNGDVVAIVDRDTDCDDLWDEIDRELEDRHCDTTYYIYYRSRDRYYKHKRNRNSRKSDKSKSSDRSKSSDDSNRSSGGDKSRRGDWNSRGDKSSRGDWNSRGNKSSRSDWNSRGDKRSGGDWGSRGDKSNRDDNSARNSDRSGRSDGEWNRFSVRSNRRSKND